MWKFSKGDRPNTVTVLERKPGGILYARAWSQGRFVYESLGHRDKERAKLYAKEQARKLEDGEAEIGRQRVTLAQVFAAYLEFRTPKKALSEQQADERRAELWARVLGTTNPYDISSAQWDTFIENRSSGAIDARGSAVAEKDRKAVRARSVEADCIWLWLVFNWATNRKLGDKRYLMRENPARGFEMPKEKNPLRPVATQDRYETLRAVTDNSMMEVRPNGKRIVQRSYLSELLDIVAGTGRRISAVCQLRFDDLLIPQKPAENAPFGAIRWPADTDKTEHESIAPISPDVRAAIDRIKKERPGIGNVPLFPSPTDPTQPISRHLADAWLRKAEESLGMTPLKGGLWHPYRRMWATARKHLPDKDVAQAGGWTSLDSLKKCYQHADAKTMFSVVMSGGQVRAAK